MNGDYLWKIDQAYGVGFNDEFQMFPVNSAINVRFIAAKNPASLSKLRWRIYFEVKDTERSIFNKIEICKENKVKAKVEPFAKENKKESMAQYLVHKGADVNATNIFNNTSLILASKCGHLDIVKLLIETVADLNLKNIISYL